MATAENYDDSSPNSNDGDDDDDNDNNKEIEKISDSLTKPASDSINSGSDTRTTVITDDSSPDSSGETEGGIFGCKKLLRTIKDFAYSEIIDPALIESHPENYYVANYTGRHLGYFKNNEARRQYVQEKVMSVIDGNPLPYKSPALNDAEKEPGAFENLSEDDKKKFRTKEKELGNLDFLKSYTAPNGLKNTYTESGNEFISTSKDVFVPPKYADHPNVDNAGEVREGGLLPDYRERPERPKGKPKHRLIGLVTVIVHRVDEYQDRPKADIGQLRQQRLKNKDQGLAGPCAVERDNQEVIFHWEIPSKNIAGYIPLVYPNLASKNDSPSLPRYDDDDLSLFVPDHTRSKRFNVQNHGWSLGINSKKKLYESNGLFQSQLAMAYVERRNPNAILVRVDEKGDYYKVKMN